MFVVLLSLRVMVAWYMTDCWRQFPSRGHEFFCRQLHFLLLFAVEVSVVAVALDFTWESRILLLWLSMICFVLGYCSVLEYCFVLE